MKKLSFIVPVYNTSKYLEKCLKSLINQKKVDFEYEIIIVNDGSPDNSEEIILKFKNKYPDLIQYIKKENGGISSARNEGLKIAKGEYISFIDSDDYVEKNLLEMFKNQIDNNDLFIFGYNEVYETKMLTNVMDSCCNISPNECYKLLFEEKSIRGYVWNKILKNNIIQENQLMFNEKISYIEDLTFIIEYLSKCKNIRICNSSLYNYVQRENSLINSKFNPNKLSALLGFENIIELLKKENKDVLPIAYYNYYEMCYELSVRIKKSGELKKYKKEYKFLRAEMKKRLNKFMFNRINMKYKIKALIKFLLYDVIFLIRHR